MCALTESKFLRGKNDFQDQLAAAVQKVMTKQLAEANDPASSLQKDVQDQVDALLHSPQARENLGLIIQGAVEDFAARILGTVNANHAKGVVEKPEPNLERALLQIVRVAAAHILGSNADEIAQNYLSVLQQEEQDRYLNMTLEEFGFSARAISCLQHDGIRSVRDVVARTAEELLGILNLGQTTLREIEYKLREKGLTLGSR